MLSAHPRLNSTVFREAELFTDGPVTDAVLQGVASMRSLPLPTEPGAAPTVVERTEAAERELICAMSSHRVEATLYRTARLCLGMANQRPAAERRAAQVAAMGALNRARASLRKAERRLAAAQAAIAVLAI